MDRISPCPRFGTRANGSKDQDDQEEVGPGLDPAQLEALDMIKNGFKQLDHGLVWQLVTSLIQGISEYVYSVAVPHR